MMRYRKQTAGLERGLIFLGLALAGAFLAWNLWGSRTRIASVQRDRLVDQARIIDENLGRQLTEVNHALETLQEDLPEFSGRADGPRFLNMRLAALSRSMPGVRTFFILDGAGRAIASNRPGLIGQDFHDRLYFRIARASNDPGMLHVSSPIRNALGTFAIDLERSTVDRQGRFSGLVAAALDPEYFTTLLHSVNYAPDMWSSLAHGDGTLFLMVPDQGFGPGANLAQPGSLFSRHRDSGQAATVLTGRSQASGQWRMTARRTVSPALLRMDAPLMVAASRDLGALYAPWRREARLQGALFGLLVLAAVSGLLAHQRRQLAHLQLARVQEQLLRENEERMRLFFDRQLVGMAITSPRLGWLKVNDRLCEMLGYPREELMALSWADLTHPDDLEGDLAAFQGLVTGAVDKYVREKRYVRKDGTPVFTELSVGCVRHPDGELDYVLALAVDVTERKRAEREVVLRQAELLELNRSLEARVGEAVAELRAKDQVLITQGRQAAMGEMIGNIAHQWRQPLNALSMVLINLRDAQRFHDTDPGSFQEALTRGDALIQSMSTTINDFRDFFRPEKARVPFSVLAQVKSTVALVAPSYRAKGIEVEIEGGAGLQGHGLPNELAQVVLNLLGNAREAIQASGVNPGRIGLRLEQVDGWGILTVTDNGGGIPEQHLDRIFDPYFSTRESGTGIGLYMSRQILEQSMGGRITARNGTEGAEFTVAFPLAGD